MPSWGPDSGRIIILDPKKSSFVSWTRRPTFNLVLSVSFLVTIKLRRILDREKVMLAYILNRDAAANLTISSPLEAHKNAAIIHHIVGLDIGFENPMFAALEVESGQDPTGEAFNKAEKILTYYGLGLGLNHVVCKWSEATDSRANLLVQVQGGQLASSDRFDGPSGAPVCCKDHIIYYHIDVPQHRVPIPQRKHPLEDPGRPGLIITSAVMHKMKGTFFFLLQSEDSDLYKVTIEPEEERVKSLEIMYFDTVPVASSLCILKSGFLFVASEFGNHLAMMITNLNTIRLHIHTPALQQIGAKALLPIHPQGIRMY